MQDQKPFLVLRYSLVEEDQGALHVEELPTPKGRAVLVSILNDREFSKNGVSYSFVGFAPAKPSPNFDFPENRFFVGKTAKLRQAHVGEKVPGDIIEYEADDWIPLVTIVDLEQQYIFIQKDWRFGAEEQIARAVQTGLRGPILERYNHRVFVEPKTRKENFWKVINDHGRVYKVELGLISPNILETNKKAREALTALNELFAQDAVSITLENESGELNVPKNPVEDYVDYISEGEGRWRVTTEGVRGGKKTHSSSEVAETVELPVPSEQQVLDERQLELETGEPAPNRSVTDSRMVAEAYIAIGRALRR